MVIRHRRPRATPKRSHRIAAVFEQLAPGTAAPALAFPGIAVPEPEGAKRRFVAGSFATLLHAAGVGFLLLLASLAPVIEEELIPVQLLREEAAEEEPAPAPRALAERRALNYAPSLQAVTPQVVNPRIIADASFKKFEMAAVNPVAAPTRIAHSRTVVERVSAVRSPVVARASNVDVSNVGGPVVRGPVVAEGSGRSAGPRRIASAAAGTSSGTGTLALGGSSVREGVISNRDVLGTPHGAPAVTVDTAVGDSFMSGTGGSGSGTGGSSASATSCLQRPQVQAYIGVVESRTLDRWMLPPGVPANQKVTLRFRLDVAGSPSKVEILAATDNALGVSAVDALRAASPFPPMPEAVRCLSRAGINATFTNPGTG